MTQNRWALIVGIDKYPLFAPHGQLEGCVRDAREMARVLREKFGFTESRTTLLLDDQATHDGILNALKDLAGRVREDDVVVFHYSGHGSQRPLPAVDRSEPDGMEEVLVPYDSGHRDPFPNRDIPGKEIHAWLREITRTTPYVTLILDCCHSGTVHRGYREGEVEQEVVRVRQVEPDKRMPTDSGRPRLRDFHGGPAEFARYVVLAACRNKEVAYEVDHGGESHGAMSWFLLRELDKLPPGACPTYRDVFEPVITRVHDLNHKRQLPQLEGLRDRELFGLAELKPRRFVPVRERWADRVVLGAGATCGLEQGAVLTVFPPQERQHAEPIGKVEIIEVRAVTATARILEESRPDAIGPWSRAVGETSQEDLFQLAQGDGAGLDPWARYRKILGLRNDASPLAGKIDFEVARLSPELCWVRVEADEDLVAGEKISFAVTNHARVPLHVYVLDFGLTGDISLVYPPRGASDPLEPGRCVEIGTRPGEDIELYVPEGVDEGEEFLKLFITTREADLESLFQASQRPSPRPHRVTREFRANLDGDREDWTTIERRFRVKRRGRQRAWG